MNAPHSTAASDAFAAPSSTVATAAAAAVGTPGPLDPAEGLIRQLYTLGSVRRELGRAAQRELASQGFSALLAISHRGACRVSDIATDLQIDLSVASRQIAALVNAGHVERRPDPADGRAHLLHLTPAGTGAISRAHEQMVGVLAGALDSWAPAEIEALAHGLERLTQSFATLPSAEQEIAP